MATEETFAGKLMFIEDGRPKVRNFTSLVIHTSTGERVELPRFKGWVELASGTGETRPLHVLLSRADTKRMVRGYVKANRSWTHKTIWSVCLIVAGWLLRSVVAAL